jgi:hypothetical protein
VLVVSGRDAVKTRSTRLGWNFFDKDLPVAVVGLLQSRWSLDISVWYVRHVTSTRRGFSLPGLARVGHRLLLPSRLVMIWTPEGHPT